MRNKDIRIYCCSCPVENIHGRHVSITVVGLVQVLYTHVFEYLVWTQNSLKTLSTTKPNKKTKIHVLVAVPYHSQHALVEFSTYTAGWSPKIIGYSLIMISSKTTCFFPNCLELPSAGPPSLFALLRCPFFGLVSDIFAS